MAKISHPNESQYIIELIKSYTEAQEQLVKIVGQKQSRRTNTEYEKRLMSQINGTLKQLIDESKLWTNSNVPRQYKKAVNRTVKAYKDMGIKIDGYDEFEKIHQRKIDILVRNSVDDFTKANIFIGRNINDTIRQISIEASRQATITGRNVKQLRQDLVDRFIDNKITAIKTKNGRRINLDSYAETVARSVIREAENTAVIEHVEATGNDLVRMSSHPTSCPVCAPLQGRVYSISGNDKRYPSLDFAYSGGYLNIHPNCRHFITPYEPALDKDRAETKAFSNRSFKIDPRSNSQKINYDREQRNNRKRNADKKQWERWKIVMPNETPKTLSGFRKSKKGNSKKYQKLQSQYRSIRLTQN